MTGGQIAVGVVAVGGVGLVAFLLYDHLHKTPPQIAPRSGSSGGGTSIGNAIAAVGGAAVAELGKEGSSALADYIRGLG